MTEKVGTYYWVRVGVMICSLIGVVTVIRWMRQPVGAELTLCPTRVSSVAVIGKTAVFQDDLKWYRASEGERVELDPIAVERWFSRYCTLPAETVVAPPAQGVPILTLAYVSGTPLTLNQATDDIFGWGEKYFRSEKLKEAIEALNQLPTAKHPGHTHK